MAEASYIPRLKTQYLETIRPALQERLKYQNKIQVPQVEKIVLNMGVGEAVADSKKIKSAFEDLQAIAGQKPVITNAKTSIATLKTREVIEAGVDENRRERRRGEEGP